MERTFQRCMFSLARTFIFKCNSLTCGICHSLAHCPWPFCHQIAIIIIINIQQKQVQQERQQTTWNCCICSLHVRSFTLWYFSTWFILNSWLYFSFVDVRVRWHRSSSYQSFSYSINIYLLCTDLYTRAYIYVLGPCESVNISSVQCIH